MASLCATGVVVAFLSVGCTVEHVFNQSPQEIVIAIQELAPWVGTPSYKIEPIRSGQRWTVVTSEAVSTNECDEVTFRILHKDGGRRSIVTVEAVRVSTRKESLAKRQAPAIARRFADLLEANLNSVQPRT